MKNQYVLVRASLSSIFLWLSFFPADLGFFAFFALVPWLGLVDIEPRPRRFYLHAALGSALFPILALQWLRLAHPMMYATWLFMILYTTLYWVLSLALLRYFQRKKFPLSITFPIVVVSAEYMRTHFPTGFSWLEPSGLYHPIGFNWYCLGYSQHDFISFIQIADIAGVYGVSFLVALVNVFLYLVIRYWFYPAIQSTVPVQVQTVRLLFLTLTVFLVILTNIMYGFTRLAHQPMKEGPMVAALQGSIPQEVKILRGDELLQPYMNLWEKAVLGEDPAEIPDLVIWPETSCPDDWFSYYDARSGKMVGQLLNGTDDGSDLGKAIHEHRRSYIARITKIEDYGPFSDRFASRFNIPILLGLNTIVREKDDRLWKYNSALLLNAFQEVGRYDKMHLVPFGEYVPLGSIFPWLQIFTPYRGDYSCKRGESWTRFPLRSGAKTYHFATIICYEDSDPALARQYVADPKNSVDFFVNISNDGWFRGSEEHEQHLAICRFRAIETRRSIVRAVNMGISAIIDSDGKVIHLPGSTWSESKKMEGIVRGRIPIDDRVTQYARSGDWLPIFCWILVLSGLLFPGLIRPSYFWILVVLVPLFPKFVRFVLIKLSKQKTGE